MQTRGFHHLAYVTARYRKVEEMGKEDTSKAHTGTVTRAESDTNSTIPPSVILLEANYAITEGEPVTALRSRCSLTYWCRIAHKAQSTCVAGTLNRPHRPKHAMRGALCFLTISQIGWSCWTCVGVQITSCPNLSPTPSC